MNLETISKNWQNFIEQVNDEKFSVASHLQNSVPIDFNDRTIVVKLNGYEDQEILEGDFKNIECLQNISKKQFGKSLLFKFEVDKISAKNASAAKTIHESDDPLIRAIKNELGGK